MSWSRAFDEPIPLPRGRQLVTLKDAATYIQKLPKAEQLGRLAFSHLHRLGGCERSEAQCRFPARRLVPKESRPPWSRSG
jgi:hypothetical protein